MRRCWSFPDSLYNRLQVMESGCIEFTGGRDRNGYGKIGIGGRTVNTHIAMYELEVGPIPDGLELHHICENRPCVNVDHLEPMTHRENLLLGDTTITAKNAAKTHCPQGHEYAGDNLIVEMDKLRRSSRRCRECRKARDKVRRKPARAS